MIAGEFSVRLIEWHEAHGRHDLPWQGTRDPYRIWLSEIMLQQTQVGTVIPYYLRFLDRFPKLEALAAAPLPAVLELWAGLGYYARARNLHRCAQWLVAAHAAQFPDSPEAMRALPGIGRSTAAAICAFAYGTRAAILDGNVKRVLARCFAVRGYPGVSAVERELWALAERLLPERGIEKYTQGLMDLGASICVRRRPLCTICPFYESCEARRQGIQGELPMPRPKKSLPEREASMLVFTDGERVLLERRPPSGIWGGLLSLPEGGVAEARQLSRRTHCRLLGMQSAAKARHSFTHFRMNIQTLLCTVESSEVGVAEAGWEWVPYSALASAALPAPVRRILQAVFGESFKG